MVVGVCGVVERWIGEGGRGRGESSVDEQFGVGRVAASNGVPGGAGAIEG